MNYTRNRGRSSWNELLKEVLKEFPEKFLKGLLKKYLNHYKINFSEGVSVEIPEETSKAIIELSTGETSDGFSKEIP